jgi:hypothetical protein
MPVVPIVVITAMDGHELSGHLMTSSDIDECVDGMKEDLEALRASAKYALRAVE